MLEHIRNDIKTLVEQQKKLKPQRKTIRFSGERTVDHLIASVTVAQNKFALRHLYIVYGLLRGKSIDQIEPNRITEPSTWHIEKIRGKYEETKI